MSADESRLSLIDGTKEVSIDTRGGGRSFSTIIWVVVADGVVYVRSVDGPRGRWYQRALADPEVALLVGSERFRFRASHVDDPNTIEMVSDALRAKYRPGGSLDRMVRDEVLDTTLRLDPVD